MLRVILQHRILKPCFHCRTAQPDLPCRVGYRVQGAEQINPRWRLRRKTNTEWCNHPITHSQFVATLEMDCVIVVDKYAVARSDSNRATISSPHAEELLLERMPDHARDRPVVDFVAAKAEAENLAN